MTLVITELSNYGIAMAADSAITQILDLPGEKRDFRVLCGAQKLLHIPKIQAGVSCWGLGKIDGIPTDYWLKNFIASNEPNYNAIKEFAILLQDELRRHVPEISVQENPFGTIGFHLAGFSELNGKKLPTFYHIHNGRSQVLEKRGEKIDPKKVNANLDFPPQQLLPNQVMTWRNGDFQIYAFLDETMGNFFDSLRSLNFPILRGKPFQIPYPASLYARAEYLRFQIRLIVDIYALSNYPNVIGGQITSSTITKNGISSYITR